MWTGGGQDAVAACLQQEFANGQGLFVVVDAENYFLGAHVLNVLHERCPVWDGLSGSALVEAQKGTCCAQRHSVG